ncbi:hypothetical protein [Nakamurella sp. PAMC28650]|uniref:hypothetical protein n=1 Tax=Nakamurella sp. PAMC28650 TaxID=2762325 RepID=UPI00164E4DDD|nr:hypothetical protein [Nakamurella sp. PAMC28650]QNK82918.1 hypothetical protein H7F38_09760 [Nakamurella sp. PAMC28650]
MLIAVVSPKTSTGATTAALALTLAWPQPAMLAELDPRGGDILWGYGQGQNIGAAGLLRLQLQLSGRTQQSMSTALWKEVIELPGAGQRWWMPGLTEPRQVGSVDWLAMVRALRSVDRVDVLADCGSVFGDPVHLPRPIWSAADLVVLAVRPTLQGVHAAQNAAGMLRGDLIAGGMGVERLVSVVIGCARAYPTKKVAEVLAEHAPVVGELPYDPDSADVLGGLKDQPKRFARSALMKGAIDLGQQLGSRVMQMQPPRPVAPARPAFSPRPELRRPPVPEASQQPAMQQFPVATSVAAPSPVRPRPAAQRGHTIDAAPITPIARPPKLSASESSRPKGEI